MNWVDDLLDDLKLDEGFRPSPYRDSVGKLTIGYGWNLDARPMRIQEAEVRLISDIAEAVAELTWAFPWFVGMSDNRKRALINMCFNMGMTKLRGFTKMIRALAREDYETAAAEALDSKWSAQVGARAQRIAELMRNG